MTSLVEPESYTPHSVMLIYSRRHDFVEGLAGGLDTAVPRLEVHFVDEPALLSTHIARLSPDLTLLDLRDEQETKWVEHKVLDADVGALVTIGGDSERFSDLDNLKCLEATVSLRSLVKVLERELSPDATTSRASPEHIYRDILEGSADGVFVVVSGVLRWVNEAFASSVGAPVDQLIHRVKLADLIREDQRQQVDEAIQRIELTPHAHEVFEVAVSEGARLEIHLRSSVVDGRRALVGIARDVTALRALQQDLEQAKADAHHQERLQTLGELAAGVAHDFNNHLERIRARILRTSRDASDTTRRSLQEIDRIVVQAGETVDRIRTFARPDDPSIWQALRLDFLIREAVQTALPYSPMSVTFRMNVPADLEVRGNGAALRDVFDNLIRNAIDATEGSPLRHVSVSGWKEDGRICVAVDDSGPGIPQPMQTRLFRPFVTTKGEKGTGLGLAICHRLVHQHGGTIAVADAPNGGARFFITLPPASDWGQEKPVAGCPAQSLLVVEDDPAVSSLIHDLMTERGYNVRAVSNAQEALKAVRRRPVEVMLTDLDLPRMSGWELIQRVREVQSDIRVVLMTGWPINSSDEEVEVHGVEAILRKPFTIDGLLRIFGDS